MTNRFARDMAFSFRGKSLHLEHPRWAYPGLAAVTNIGVQPGRCMRAVEVIEPYGDAAWVKFRDDGSEMLMDFADLWVLAQPGAEPREKRTEKLWVRAGDVGEYQEFDWPDEAAAYLAESHGVRLVWRHGALGVQAEGFEEDNHISLFWAQPKGLEAGDVRGVSDAELGLFNKALAADSQGKASS